MGADGRGAWYLTTESGRPELVALVQTATSLPVLLFALPAGALADLVDRRRLLLAVQGTMVVVAGALAGVALLGWLTPWRLLAFTAARGVGVALTAPAWQASVPELVPRAELASAAALNGIAVNLARARARHRRPAGGGGGDRVDVRVQRAQLHRVPRRPRPAPASSTVRPEGERLAGAVRLAIGHVGHAPAILRVLGRNRAVGAAGQRTVGAAAGGGERADGPGLAWLPLMSRRLYSVSVDALADRSMDDEAVAATVVDEGDEGSGADGLETDDAGRIYITAFEHNAILRRLPDGQIEAFVHDPRLLWPDTMSVAADGHLYVTANQLMRQERYQRGEDLRRKPYTLFRTPIDAGPVLLR